MHVKGRGDFLPPEGYLEFHHQIRERLQRGFRCVEGALLKLVRVVFSNVKLDAGKYEGERNL